MLLLSQLLVVCLVHALSVQGRKTACRVSPVEDLEMTNLTCYFPEDVSKSKMDFKVHHYNNKDGKENIVLDCLWYQEQLECFKFPGYQFDKNITARMTIQIPRVTENQTGKYACSLAGLKLDDFDFCELFLSTEQASCDISEDATPEINLTCKFPEDLRKTKKGFVVYRYYNSGNPAAVVDCLWHVDSLKCTSQPGYEPSTTATDTFVVRIVQRSGNKTESYQCYIYGSRPDQASICSSASTEGGVAFSDVGCQWKITIIIVVLLLAVLGTIGCLGFKFRKRLSLCWNRCLKSCKSRDYSASQGNEHTTKNMDDMSKQNADDDFESRDTEITFSGHRVRYSRHGKQPSAADAEDNNEVQTISLAKTTLESQAAAVTDPQDEETEHLLSMNSLTPKNSDSLQVLLVTEATS